MTSGDQGVVIAAAVRTPMGRFGGSLASMTALELGAIACRAALARASLNPAEVGETIMGNARQAGVGPNPARQIAHRAGIPDSSIAYTINMACASGLRAVINAWQTVRLGVHEVVLAGGAEAMSRTPYLLEEARWGHRLGDQRVTDGMYRDGFLCPLCEQIMGDTAENLAVKYGITRAEQDAFSAESQQRSERARSQNLFNDEIVPISIEGRRGTTVVDRDEHPRDGVTAESLARLPPVFRNDGTVHAGSSSGIADGAAAMIVMSGTAAERLGVRPMARLRAWADAGVDPAFMGIGPVPAIRKLLDATGLSLNDIDLIELNEAFAAQVLACHRELSFDLDRVNVNGGAISLGHPIGATGARIVVTLLHELKRRSARLGMATLCVSGGLGVALLVENLSD